MKSLYLFLLGFISCAFLIFLVNNLFDSDIPLTGFLVSETSNPSDRITEENIFLYNDEVILRIPNATISNYANTGSMKPILDENASGIRIVPEKANDIKVGDIVSFRYFDNLIVHRVIRIGVDGKGTYFITKGDSNIMKEKIRFEDIEYVTIGILW